MQQQTEGIVNLSYGIVTTERIWAGITPTATIPSLTPVTAVKVTVQGERYEGRNFLAGKTQRASRAISGAKFPLHWIAACNWSGLQGQTTS